MVELSKEQWKHRLDFRVRQVNDYFALFKTENDLEKNEDILNRINQLREGSEFSKTVEKLLCSLVELEEESRKSQLAGDDLIEQIKTIAAIKKIVLPIYEVRRREILLPYNSVVRKLEDINSGVEETFGGVELALSIYDTDKKKSGEKEVSPTYLSLKNGKDIIFIYTPRPVNLCIDAIVQKDKIEVAPAIERSRDWTNNAHFEGEMDAERLEDFTEALSLECTDDFNRYVIKEIVKNVAKAMGDK